MERSIDIVAAGHICIDIIPDLSGLGDADAQALFRPGKLLKAGPVTFATGGAVSNAGIALHILGLRTQLMGKVGDDILGRLVTEIVERYDPGLAEGMVVAEGVETSYTVVINPPSIDRIFFHCPGANDTFTADDVRYDAVEQARLFHFGYPPIMREMFADDGAQLVAMLRRIKELGVTTSVDMALPDPTSPAGKADWETILGSILPYVDVFLPSIEETLYMLRRETYDRLSADGDIVSAATPPLLSSLSSELLELGVPIVGLKLGDRGLYLRTGDRVALSDLGSAQPTDLERWTNREFWAPCFEVDVVGTTGAGDATIAGFLAGLLRDLSPEDTLTGAVAVGACNVEAADALSGVRGWEETWDRVRAGWSRCPVTIGAPGWHYDPERSLWIGSADGH